MCDRRGQLAGWFGGQLASRSIEAHPPPLRPPVIYITTPHNFLVISHFWQTNAYGVKQVPDVPDVPSTFLPYAYLHTLLGVGCNGVDYSPLGETLVHSAGLLESTRVDYVGCWAVDALLNKFYFSLPW